MYPSPNPWASPRGTFGLIVFVLCLVGLFMVYRAGGDADREPGEPATDRNGGAASGSAPAARAPITVEVDRVVDGDTAKVFYEGRSEYVRYIGIDTPESVKPDSPVECFGEQAKRFNDSLVAGERVRLVFGPELRDRFDRLLAYLYVSDVMVNAKLLRGGFAQTLTIPPNDAKSGMFERIEAEARDSGRGLWGACS